MSEFFRSKRYHRAATERVSDWLTRFEEGLNRLRDDGVDLTKVGDLVGWYMLDMCSLSAERCERVLGALPDENYWNARPDLQDSRTYKFITNYDEYDMFFLDMA